MCVIYHRQVDTFIYIYIWVMYYIFMGVVYVSAVYVCMCVHVVPVIILFCKYIGNRDARKGPSIIRISRACICDVLPFSFLSPSSKFRFSNIMPPRRYTYEYTTNLTHVRYVSLTHTCSRSSSKKTACTRDNFSTKKNIK